MYAMVIQDQKTNNYQLLQKLVSINPDTSKGNKITTF